MSVGFPSRMYWKLHKLDILAIFWKCAWVKTTPLKSAGAKDPLYTKCNVDTNVHCLKIYYHHHLCEFCHRECHLHQFLHKWVEFTHILIFSSHKIRVMQVLTAHSEMQRSYTRWLHKIIYKTEMKFWAVLGSRCCREKKNLPTAISMQLFGVVF